MAKKVRFPVKSPVKPLSPKGTSAVIVRLMALNVRRGKVTPSWRGMIDPGRLSPA